MEFKLIVRSVLIGLISINYVSCRKQDIGASGNQVSVIRTTESFNSVKVSGSSSVFIVYGNNFKVELKGSDNLVAQFASRVESEQLILEYEDVRVGVDDVKVYITMPVLNTLIASGSSSFEISGNFPNQQKFEAKISGKAIINFLGTLRAENLKAEITGAGNMDIEKVLAKNAEFKLTGNGNILTSVADKLVAQISGSGNVYYNGIPNLTTFYSGSGRVIKK